MNHLAELASPVADSANVPVLLVTVSKVYNKSLIVLILFQNDLQDKNMKDKIILIFYKGEIRDQF